MDKNDGKLCKELQETLNKFINENKHPTEMTTKEMDVMLEEISTLSANSVRKYNMRRSYLTLKSNERWMEPTNESADSATYVADRDQKAFIRIRQKEEMDRNGAKEVWSEETD